MPEREARSSGVFLFISAGRSVNLFSSGRFELERSRTESGFSPHVLNATDEKRVKAISGQATLSAEFRSGLNAGGCIDTADIMRERALS